MARTLVINHPRKYDPSGGIILALCNSGDVKADLKDLFLVEVLKACLAESRYDIAINLWGLFEPVLTYYANKIIPSLIYVFEDSPQAIEYKLYFLKKFYILMDGN